MITDQPALVFYTDFTPSTVSNEVKKDSWAGERNILKIIDERPRHRCGDNAKMVLKRIG
jgi:hypothetical protein